MQEGVIGESHFQSLKRGSTSLSHLHRVLKKIQNITMHTATHCRFDKKKIYTPTLDNQVRISNMIVNEKFECHIDLASVRNRISFC